MTSPPAGAPVAAPCAGLYIVRERLPTDHYLGLYREIGEQYQWDYRLRMDMQELDALLGDPTFALFVLRLDGRAIGMCEFAGWGSRDVEIKHFGIVPSAYGRGLGRYLLDRCLRECWSHAPLRVWLHTDTNDHPNALRTYENAGFSVFRRAVESFPD